MAETSTSKRPMTYNQKVAVGVGLTAAAIGLYWLVKPKAAAAGAATGKDKGKDVIITLPPEKTLANGGATRLVDGPIVQPFYVIGDSGAAAFMKAMPALIGNATPGTGYAALAQTISAQAKSLVPPGSKTSLVFLGNDFDPAKPGTQTDITAAVVAIQKALAAQGTRVIFVAPPPPGPIADLLHGVLNQNAEYIIERPGEEATFDLVKSALGLAPGQGLSGPVNVRAKRILTYTDATHYTGDDNPVQQNGTDYVLPDATNVDAALKIIYKYGLDNGMTRFSVYGANAATGQIVDQITSPDWPLDIPAAVKL